MTVPLWPSDGRHLVLVGRFRVVAVKRVDSVPGDRKQVEGADEARGGGADGVEDARVWEVLV